MEITLLHNNELISCTIHKNGNEYILSIPHLQSPCTLKIEKWDKANNVLYCSDQTIRFKVQCIQHQGILYGIVWSTHRPHPSSIELQKEDPLSFFPTKNAAIFSKNSSPTVVAPLTGKIVSLLIQEGEAVVEGAPLLIIESMKMENEIRAHRNGIIKTILIAPDDVVETNQTLIIFNEPLDEGEADEKNKIKNR
jgi:biotin carboxyl carrier protein